jgi:hypothetical protein
MPGTVSEDRGAGYEKPGRRIRMISPIHVLAVQFRYHDLVAEAARDRLAAEAQRTTAAVATSATAPLTPSASGRSFAHSVLAVFANVVLVPRGT